MKKVVFRFLTLFFLLFSITIITVEADTPAVSEEPSDLYGLSALLMDANTGEILFEKNGQDPVAIASTTKILTCIVVLENGNLDDIVTFSANAAAQPDVQMNAAEGEQYQLSDLLKGMMLESYNEVSVAIAEHIAGSVEAFAELMNEKAESLGCMNSYFITPNGLDAEENGLTNHSTAEDLGLILSYAVKNEEFLEITQTQQWNISECNGKRTVTASNKNRFLQEYDGLISGKTGFTSKAGYCYAGAATRDGRTLVAVTLCAGWPPNKNYKWSDTKKLLDYGFENYEYRDIDYLGVEIPDSIQVEDGIDADGNEVKEIQIILPETEDFLLRNDETYYGKVYLKTKIHAPIAKNDVVGRIEIYRNDELLAEEKIIVIDNVDESSLWYKIWQKLCYFFDKII